MSFEYLDPKGTTEAAGRSLAPRPQGASALVLGVLGNGKPNSREVLLAVAARLVTENLVSDVVELKKPSPYRTAPDEVLDEAAARCHLLLTGVGD